ncbi:MULTISPECIES: cupin domain-containing protein [Lysinibacillus]|uniref:cupin domain-containing protein n=1 Tax=Lysinibacillus TaxID=400634 RepID=UPI0001DA54CD|nr:cupin domain-containing protein [Lysinibacillus capsici]EFI69584.1 cupin 2 domain-containing protein [Lysinibacillus fusiformis ZC1]EKU44961.1 cupin 2 domain-containing protein [Lysinibacillus fusiformis ZB2]MED4700158.1 cupin domain-containing protein [Lysinibacillus capsici]
MIIKEVSQKDIVQQNLFQDKYNDSQIKFGFVQIKPGERLPLEGTTSHLENEYSFIVKGTLTGESGGENYRISQGEASYIPAGEPHWCKNDSDEMVELVYALLDIR